MKYLYLRKVKTIRRKIKYLKTLMCFNKGGVRKFQSNNFHRRKSCKIKPRIVNLKDLKYM